MCNRYGISVAGVTKCTLGMPEVANAMICGGVTWIGESRLDNIERLKNNNIKVPFLLMRSPHKSEIERVVSLADISLNTEYEIIEDLSNVSIKNNIIHKIIIMVDLGDLREGVLPNELIPLVKEILKMKGVKIIGIGTNLTDLNGTIPTTANNQQLVNLAEEVEKKFNIKLEYLSAGNSSSLKLLESGKIPSRINNFRIGEGILLGRETLYREKFPNTYQDAFGNIPSVKDKGMRTRCILNVGRQDMNVDGLSPQKSTLEILGATSDHLLIDSTNDTDLSVGDVISFNLNYSALLASMTFPFVEKIVI